MSPEISPETSPEAATGHTDAPGVEELVTLLRRRRLTPAQRRIARYVLERPGEVGALGSGELAALTDVSQPSVSRFAQALGFAGYPQLRRYLRSVGVAPGEATHTAMGAGGQAASPPTRFQRALADEVANLQSLARGGHDDALADAGARLAAAPAVVICGLRASAPLAGYVAFFARKIHPDVRLLTHGGSPAVDELRHARDAGADTLLCLALPRCPQETRGLVDVARTLGYALVTLTDDPLAPVADGAAVALTATVGTHLVFDSQAGPMLLAAALLDAMAEAAPTRTQQRLEDFERMAADHGYFDSP